MILLHAKVENPCSIKAEPQNTAQFKEGSDEIVYEMYLAPVLNKYQFPLPPLFKKKRKKSLFILKLTALP